MPNYLTNPKLPLIKPYWPGNTLDAKNRFVNHEFPFSTSFADVWKWQTGPKPHKKEKKTDLWRPNLVQDISFTSHKKDCLVWLGHAWFFLRLNGIDMLIDPVFFKIPMVRQLVANPYPVGLFDKIDYILLSHDHRDHADAKSLRALGHQNPNTHILTGLKMTPMLRKWCQNTITEMGWYQQFTSPAGDLKVTYLPTRHWGCRYFSDTNERLWGAFMIEAGGKTLYFGADSGYGGHYSELPELFPKIDVAMLGIGAFRPEWFMHQAHMSPTHAAQAFNESGASVFLPMHHGTLDLSDEPVGEPYRTIRSLESEGQIKGEVWFPKVGEAMILE